MARVAGYVLQTLGGELQTIVEGIGRIHALQVEGVGLEEIIGMQGDDIGYSQQHTIDLLRREGEEGARGCARGLKKGSNHLINEE